MNILSSLACEGFVRVYRHRSRIWGQDVDPKKKCFLNFEQFVWKVQTLRKILWCKPLLRPTSKSMDSVGISEKNGVIAAFWGSDMLVFSNKTVWLDFMKKNVFQTNLSETVGNCGKYQFGFLWACMGQPHCVWILVCFSLPPQIQIPL